MHHICIYKGKDARVCAYVSVYLYKYVCRCNVMLLASYNVMLSSIK